MFMYCFLILLLFLCNNGGVDNNTHTPKFVTRNENDILYTKVIDILHPEICYTPHIKSDILHTHTKNQVTTLKRYIVYMCVCLI